MKQLIVGWRRGGLGYLYQTLKNYGVDVGDTFSQVSSAEEAQKLLGSTKEWEVSSNIVPFLSELSLPKDLAITFLLRDPMRVINSIYFLGLLHNEKQTDFHRLLSGYLNKHKLEKSFADLKGRPGQFACFYTGLWLDIYSNLKHKNKRYVKVEEFPQILLKHFDLSFANRPAHFFAARTDTNSSLTNYPITFKDLPENCKQAMEKMCRDLGYYKPLWHPRGGHAHYLSPEWHH